MTPNKEDYLKKIYELGSMEKQVSNKQIVESLQIAPAFVTEMPGKLRREGLTHYEPHKGSRLTDAEIRTATTLVCGYRFWEVFLICHLRYSWSEAHEGVKLLKHITPSHPTARPDQFPNHPTCCPHGSATPHPDGQVDLTPLQSFNLFPIG